VSTNAPSRSAVRTGVETLPWAELSGVRLAIVLWGGLGVIDVARVAGAPSYAVLGTLALLVTASSIGTRTSTALGAAAIGWMIVNGFVVHHLGVLGFDGTPDAARLLVLVALALVATRVRR
jgi:hypothetical protein